MRHTNPLGRIVTIVLLSIAATLTAAAVPAGASSELDRIVLRIPLGRAEVVVSKEEVKTVAIAEPKIADAAVGSERSVVVNGKSVGRTSLVVYNTFGRFYIYDIEVYVPNADRQVSLAVQVAEINDNAKKELGFDLTGQAVKNGDAMSGGLFPSHNSFVSNPLVPRQSSDGFFNFTRFGKFSIQAAWKALEETGDLRVLANPTLVARSGEKASFLAGGEFPIPIAQNSTRDASTITIEWKEFGVKVDFTPTVREDGGIDLVVAPEVSQIDFSNPLALSGYTVPTIVTRRTSTTVRLEAGEHLVIGGLKQTEHLRKVKRVPVLGHIPVFGLAFSSRETSDVDRDLLVVVSPTIVNGSTAAPTLPGEPKEKE